MHPQFFYSLVAIFFVIALATTPGAPLGDFANNFIGVTFTVFAGALGLLGVSSALLVGVLSFGLLGFLVALIALIMIFRLQLNLNFFAMALFLFAVMLVVV